MVSEGSPGLTLPGTIAPAARPMLKPNAAADTNTLNFLKPAALNKHIAITNGSKSNNKAHPERLEKKG
ncbi:hypothetical protein FACS189447_02070 [Spirochaetia bacterium]|nr:hypothetical protein FACS189447_02070 [Spirochaetia bacterium]